MVHHTAFILFYFYLFFFAIRMNVMEVVRDSGWNHYILNALLANILSFWLSCRFQIDGTCKWRVGLNHQFLIKKKKPEEGKLVAKMTMGNKWVYTMFDMRRVWFARTPFLIPSISINLFLAWPSPNLLIKRHQSLCGDDRCDYVWIGFFSIRLWNMTTFSEFDLHLVDSIYIYFLL